MHQVEEDEYQVEEEEYQVEEDGVDCYQKAVQSLQLGHILPNRSLSHSQNVPETKVVHLFLSISDCLNNVYNGNLDVANWDRKPKSTWMECVGRVLALS